MKLVHHLTIGSTRNGTVPMKITSCGRLIQRGSEYLRADLLITNNKPNVTCGSCQRITGGEGR